MARHEPTHATRKAIRRMVRAGIPKTDMAGLMGIAIETFNRHYGDYCVQCRAEDSVRVSTALYMKALQGDNQAMIFWLKSQAGWKEAQEAAGDRVTVVVRDLTGNIEVTPADPDDHLALAPPREIISTQSS